MNQTRLYADSGSLSKITKSPWKKKSGIRSQTTPPMCSPFSTSPNSGA
ncbi:hypothetical protein N9259_00435 [bacterium]|nr:hypothetical protein [Akkermansiaceae bacterium]MDB4491996.1 hypothetical protein [bacterium]